MEYNMFFFVTTITIVFSRPEMHQYSTGRAVIGA